MDGSYRDSPTHIPASFTKHHHPYFTPTEVDMLSDKQRGKMSMSQEDKRASRHAP
ncbi:hypothetical protein EWM64_g7819 [Hericium alpestre]|uniref:Uncharacterized protein n=1 Tax=Hericium alpestre TaxID=135208 RepID=A0A4Y9ZN29_9AGAM|nr:hypothetical protein EWM64_g7819 [Hericium alpestre]